MIQLTRLADYGIVLLTHLASQPAGTSVSARELADATHVPPATVSKVLKQLTVAGLLVSQRGAAGGYALARAADDIDLAQIVDALEGGVALTVCSEGNSECHLEPHCQVAGNWQLITQTVHDALSRISLAQMARPLHPQPMANVRFDEASGIAVGGKKA